MTEFPVRSPQSGRFKELVDRYCEGSLAETECRELQEWIRRDAEARLFFVGYLAVDSGLKWECRRGDLKGFSAETIEQELKRQSVVGSRFKMRFFWVALTVLLLVTGLLWQRSVIPPEPHFPRDAVTEMLPVIPVPSIRDEKSMIVATLADLGAGVVVERNGQPQAAVVGMKVVANDALRVPFGGSALVKLANAASIHLGSRSVLSFEHEGRPELTEGFAEVDATANTNRLAWSLRTTTADTEIRSSRFAVGTGPQQTHVRVAEGAVSVLRRRDGAMLDVEQGFCSTIAEDTVLQSMSSRYGTALMVISPNEAHDWTKFNRLIGDRLIGDRLWRSALSVKVRVLQELTEEDLRDCAVIVVSLFDFGDDEKRFLLSGISELAVPVICLEPAGFPILGMTGSQLHKDYSFLMSKANLDIARPDHPLAAGYQGAGLDLFIFNNKRTIGWARPAGAAQKIAHIEGMPDHWVLFAFDKGEAMFDRTAPERRVGLFLSPEGIEEGSPALKFIDAAIQWCVETKPNGV